jgi:hypothetical protein
MMKLGHDPLCAQHLRCTGRVQPGPENFAHSAHSIDVGPCAMPPARSALAVDLKQTVSHGSQMNKNSAPVHSGQPYPHSLPRLLNHCATPSNQICQPVSVHHEEEKTEPMTPSGAPRWCARPPLGGCTTVEWPHNGVSPCPRAPTRW